MFPRKKENPKDEQQAEQQTPDKGEPVSKSRKEMEQMQKQIEELQKEKEEMFAKLQRMAADYDNFRKRSDKQTADSIAYEKDTIIKALLPVLDDFERALAHAEEGDSVAEGVKLIYEHFKSILRSQGVEEIEAAGEVFDPAMHDAIDRQYDVSKEDDIVLKVVQKGYKLNGRRIRASRVVVNKLPAPEKELPLDEDETRDTQ